MASKRPQRSQAPPGLPSPRLAARSRAAEVQSGAPTGLRSGDQSSTPREPTAGQQSPPVLRGARRPWLPATPVLPRVRPAQGSRDEAGHDTQPALCSKWPPAARSPPAGSTGSSRSGPQGCRGAACALPRATAEPRRPSCPSMHPGPACKSLPPAGSARPFLFLRSEHVRCERAEVTVTEERKKRAAAPAGPSFARVHAGS